jgi:hypothetical protein
MNPFSDTRSNREKEQMETVRQEPNPASDGALMELGKVSDTKGGWIGPKVDTGMGLIPY